MEPIREAIKRARASRLAAAQQSGLAASIAALKSSDARIPFVELDPGHLEATRIVSHNVRDPRSKSYDMLRTQVLRAMDANDWQVLAVTSPTPACGKTTTAVNLALSIARQPERAVLLVDMDLQKPHVADTLGVKCEAGLLSVLAGKASLPDAMLRAGIGSQTITVLPTECSIPNSSEILGSRVATEMLQWIRKNYRSCTVILDMPPVLSTDDVLTVLPQIDCVLLVLAVGTSTVSDMEQCNHHLQSTQVVRIVLNKVNRTTTGYY